MIITVYIVIKHQQADVLLCDVQGLVYLNEEIQNNTIAVKTNLEPAVKGFTYVLEILTGNAFNTVLNVPSEITAILLISLQQTSKHNIDKLNSTSNCTSYKQVYIEDTVNVERALGSVVNSTYFPPLTTLSNTLNTVVWPSNNYTLLDVLSILSGHTLSVIFSELRAVVDLDKLNNTMHNLFNNMYHDMINLNSTGTSSYLEVSI